MKQGADPVLLRGQVRAEIAVPVVADAIDTTGAGDAFAGGFLLALRVARPRVTQFPRDSPPRRVWCGVPAPTVG